MYAWQLRTTIKLKCLAAIRSNTLPPAEAQEALPNCPARLSWETSRTHPPLNGWDASVTGYFKHYLGATADFSGVYGSLSGGSAGGASTSRYSYLFGPVLALRTQRATTFVHVLFGAVSQTAAPGGGFNYNGFTWAIGGGCDAGLTRRLALRIAQLDYEQVKVPNFGGPSAKGFRYSGGVVFRF